MQKIENRKSLHQCSISSDPITSSTAKVSLKCNINVINVICCSKVESLSNIIYRPRSSSRIAKEEVGGDCTDSETGSISKTKTQDSAPAHWIREIEQNKLFKKVRQEIDKNWGKFLQRNMRVKIRISDIKSSKNLSIFKFILDNLLWIFQILKCSMLTICVSLT